MGLRETSVGFVLNSPIAPCDKDLLRRETQTPSRVDFPPDGTRNHGLPPENTDQIRDLIGTQWRCSATRFDLLHYWVTVAANGSNGSIGRRLAR